MKKIKRSVLIFTLITFFTVFLILYHLFHKVPSVVPEYVLTYAENQARNYPTTLGAYYFADLVNEKTEGKIEILIYDSSALGSEPSVIQQLQIGGIDFSRISISTLADIAPPLHVVQ